MSPVDSGFADTQGLDDDPVAIAAARLTEPSEGLFLRPYLCPAGVPSIGFGSTHYEDGTRVTLRDPQITKRRARQLMRHELQTVCRPAVDDLCPGADTPERKAVLVDFVYNLGRSRLAASTLRRRVNARGWAGARRELLRWVYGGGKKLRGLVIRRQRGAAML